MKRKFVCLLLSAMMAVSVLSGCGKKDADSKAEEAMNNLGEAMENDDEEAAMAALNELDEIMQEEEDMSSSEGEGTAYPADSRWADVKLGETAAQYYDLFIKSGMTIGEVLEEIENSEEFFAFSYPNFRAKEGIKAGTVRDGTVYIEYIDSNRGDCSIDFDGESVIRLTVPATLPGNEGDVYSYTDLPIINVAMSGPSIYDHLNCKHPEAYHTAFGSYEDLVAMSSEDVENLKDTFFAGTDVELESQRRTTEGRNIVDYYYTIPVGFSWNGYSIETFDIQYNFTVDYDEDRVITWNFGRVSQYSRTWIAD